MIKRTPLTPEERRDAKWERLLQGIKNLPTPLAPIRNGERVALKRDLLSDDISEVVKSSYDVNKQPAQLQVTNIFQSTVEYQLRYGSEEIHPRTEGLTSSGTPTYTPIRGRVHSVKEDVISLQQLQLMLKSRIHPIGSRKKLIPQ